ncbi:unnamed protein product [Phytophthora lilii]|uniref:Unnamed protein product n=1 Tax=Phytophthora lilii TaxID=2077276 RepID=A0A9W6XBK5_9STRA|nr:unnamed protein product [Phytophthora lilii]
MRESIKFRTGKYAGVCPEEVLGLNDDRYLQWIATLDDYSDKDLLSHVRTNLIRDTEIQFGKHAGTQLRDLKEKNAHYWAWLEHQAEVNPKLAYIRSIATMKRYYEQKRDERIAKQKAYYQANKEQICERGRERRQGSECLRRELPDSIKVGTILRKTKPVAIDMDDPYDTAATDAGREACDEAPVIDEKKEKPELIQDEEKIVSENIVSPMSPNSSPQPDSAIVEEGNFKPIQKIFNARECFIIHRGDEYQYWIDKCALGEARVSFRLRQTNGEYVYDTKGCRVLQVVKYGGKRPYRNYIWFYNHVDMHAFIEYFHGDHANGIFGRDQTFTNGDRWFECHELFIGKDPTIKLFFDIEKVIPNALLKEYRSTYDCSANDLRKTYALM